MGDSEHNSVQKDRKTEQTHTVLRSAETNWSEVSAVGWNQSNSCWEGRISVCVCVFPDKLEPDPERWRCFTDKTETAASSVLYFLSDCLSFSPSACLSVFLSICLSDHLLVPLQTQFEANLSPLMSGSDYSGLVLRDPFQ